MIFLESSFGLFVGRFHPLLVHLPIGFLLLAGIMEWLSRKPAYQNLSGAISFSLFLGMLSSAAAAICGWLLANEGGYGSSTLFWHRWLGIGVGVLAGVAWLLKSERLKGSKALYNGSLIGMLICITITGHLGGNMTHGEDYLLQYAPGFVKKLVGAAEEKAVVMDFSKSNPDSVIVFNQLIRPLMEEKCFECHNPSKSNGGLIMTTEEDLLKGGDNGEVLHSGNAFESELFKRVTLSQSSKKFMPPKGIPLSYKEVKLLEWWINSGHSFSNSITQEEVPKEIKELLMDSYQLSTKKRPYVEIAEVEPAPEAALTTLAEKGIRIQPIASENNLLEVYIGKEASKEQLESLLEIKEQVTWLYLGNTGLTDDMLAPLAQMPNLTRVKLEKNPITATGVQHLVNAPHLESLNLYSTTVGDDVIPILESFPALQTVYLWQSEVSLEKVKELMDKKPELEINMGLSMAELQ